MRQLRPTKHDIVQWTRALRSGDYDQAQGALQTDDGFCCLGVACDIVIPKRNALVNGKMLWGLTPDAQEFAPEWLKNMDSDFCTRTGAHLTDLNDSDGFTFDEIADCLEAVYILEVLS